MTEIFEHGVYAGKARRQPSIDEIKEIFKKPIIHGHTFDPKLRVVRPYSFNEEFDKILRGEKDD